LNFLLAVSPSRRDDEQIGEAAVWDHIFSPFSPGKMPSAGAWPWARDESVGTDPDSLNP